VTAEGDVGADGLDNANWGFTKLLSAIIIVSAVVFGVACGTLIGCLLVRLYRPQPLHPIGVASPCKL